MFLIVKVDDKHYEKKCRELERAYGDAQVAGGPNDEEVLVAMIADDMTDKGNGYDPRQAGMSVYRVEDWDNAAEPHSSIHDACARGDVEAVSLLLKTGAGVNTRDRAGYTPLHWACYPLEWHHPHPKGVLAVIRLLLEKGADPVADRVSVIDLALSRWKKDHEMKTSLLDLFRQYAPEATLQAVLELAEEDPLRERMLEWYREHHPEAVMETWCTHEPRL